MLLIPLFRTINLSSNIAKEKSKAIIHSAHEKYIYKEATLDMELSPCTKNHIIVISLVISVTGDMGELTATNDNKYTRCTGLMRHNFPCSMYGVFLFDKESMVFCKIFILIKFKKGV
jgi:hypothetical protein